ncbi:hypothetical protein CTA2_10605 [Colletotrichum tanaceti]|uniref:Uncharacterized protein n=1 Tax=Colletotrichum tanaceti TaxID=1306861 RepID=A0A4U6XEU9_9PEZI|nr:hypothetical protein CTA2_10605 [Colletotrichum tanaceti]TKW54215.1 hypothetical protein CTA1_4444 [Colletotrichum tanaceti]
MAGTSRGAGARQMFHLIVRDDVPAIRVEERPICEAWLRSIGFIGPGQDGDKWEAIKKNWVGFLTATRSPARGTGRTTDWEGRQNRRNRRAIQTAFWDGADGLEALSERWPAAARRVLTQAAEGPDAPPFESLGSRWLLDKRRRFQSMWTGLVCFLAYSEQQNTLKQMGLSLSDTCTQDLIDVIQDVWTSSALGDPELLFDTTANFLIGSIMDKKATARTNAILWWTAVLVRSALSGDDEGDDFISRGVFAANILLIDVPIRDRVESMLHYSRVFILHHAFHGWKGPPSQVEEVQAELNAVDNAWLGNDSGPRPSDHHDRRTCTSAAWRSVIKHLRLEAEKSLGSTAGTPMYEVARLLARLRDVRSRTEDTPVRRPAETEDTPVRRPAETAGHHAGSSVDTSEDESDYFAEHHKAVRTMLGDRSVAEFSTLPPQQRATILRRHLTQPDPVIIGDDGLDEDGMGEQPIAAGALLRQCLFMGADDVGRRMVAEARAAYYGGNTFRIPLESLGEFLTDSLEDAETATAVPPLVRKGVIVHLWESHYAEEPQAGKDGAVVSYIQGELSMLLLFTQAKSITIRLPPSTGTAKVDTYTPQHIIQIAPVVKRLLANFGDRVDVVQDVHNPRPMSQRSLKSYWDTPTRETRRKVERGTGSLKDFLQVQIANLV